MTDKEKIRAEVERVANLYYDEERAAEALHDILMYIDTLPQEPVSVWREAKHQPKMFRKYLVRYSDGRVSGSWERHDDDFIPWKDVVKEHGFTHWCYVEDLLKL